MRTGEHGGTRDPDEAKLRIVRASFGSVDDDVTHPHPPSHHPLHHRHLLLHSSTVQTGQEE